MRSSRPASRFALAVAVSLAVHLSLLLLPREEERAPAARPIELEVVHLPPAAAAEDAAPDARSEPAALPRPAAESGAAGAPRAAGESEATAAPREGGAPAAPRGSVEGGAPATPRGAVEGGSPATPRGLIEGGTVAVPRADGESSVVAAPHAAGTGPDTVPGADGGAGPDTTARRLDLLPDRYDLAASGQPPQGDAGEVSSPPQPGVQQRLEGLLADDRAVVRGTERVDAYWGEMRRRLESKWEVDADLLADGPRRGLGVKIDKAWEGWRQQAASYAATGNPYGEGATVPGSPHVADYARPLNLPEKIGPIYEGAADEGAYRKTRTALLLVVQDEAGRVVDVRVQRSSGNAAFDRLAEANARALAQYDLGLPPDGRQTVWSFDATLITTPPLPIAGCAVDAYFIPQHCFYPLSQRVTQAVRLVGVWGAGETPGLR